MKSWKRNGLLALALCAALLAGLLLGPAAASTANVNLMAVNDTVLDTTAENMPRIVGGALYVPYAMLSYPLTGINLGVSALYSSTRRTVLVTDGQRGVTFDLQSNSAQDLDGEPVSARAMVRNTTVFVPIDWLCQYFGTIDCSRTRTPYGTLIRVTSSAAILDDQAFADAAGPQLAENLRRYQEAGGGNQGVDPVASGGVESSEAPSGAQLYLALRPGESAAECAQLLEDRGQRALFLFTREELSREDGLVRRIVGAGHTVGLALTEEEPGRCLNEAERGRELLAAAARYNALVVSAPNLDEAGRAVLEKEGYVVWSSTVLGGDWRSGSALVRGLDARRVNYVELECGAGGVNFLRGALNAMEEENCRLYQATAPELG